MKATRLMLVTTATVVSLAFTACSGNDGQPASAADQSRNASAPAPAAQPAAPTQPAQATPATQPPLASATSTPAAPAQTTPVSAPAAAVTPAAPPVVPADAKVPRIVVASTKIDFGKQPQKITLNKAVVIRNGGKADLNIQSVTPSCGCTTVDFPKVIRPGQSGKVRLKVDTGSSPGQHTKSVTIKSNDPEKQTLVVEFTLNVKG